MRSVFRKRESRIVLGLTLAVAALLTLLAYGDAIHLPFHADDLQQIPWVKETPALAYWYRLGPYGDWRPVRFMLLRAIYVTTGDLSPALLHALNLAGHAICAMLVGLLAARWSAHPRRAGPLAAALFVLFPFATNVTLWVSAISYTLAAGLGLSALLLYLEARERNQTGLHLAAALCTLMAGLVWEAGIVAAGGILLAELLLRERPYSRWVGAHLLASALPFAVIFSFSTEVPTEFLTGLHPWYNVVAWLQCLAYPLAPLATLGERAFGADAVTLMTLLGAATLAALAYVNARWGQFRRFLFTAGWAVLWSVMPLTTQPFNWFRDPTRAFYPASAGFALLWGLTLLGLEGKVRPRWVGQLLQAGLLAAALLPPYGFVREVTAVHRMAGELLWESVAAAEAVPDTLVINLPGRLTPDRRFYPLMHEGMIPIPPPTSGEMFVAAHTGGARDFRARSQGAILPPGRPYSIELADPPVTAADLRAARRVLVADYADRRIALVEAGAINVPNERNTAPVRFGEEVVLHRADCRWLGETEIEVMLEWEVLEPVAGAPTIFVHWLGSDGALVAQADGDALRGLYPLTAWQPGERVQEYRRLRDLTPTGGTVAVGVWDPIAGERWSATDPAGVPLPDDAFHLPPCTEAPHPSQNDE